jgi:hypothetical protein
MRSLALVAVLAFLATGCGGGDHERAAAGSPCGAGVDRGVLPKWARTGFSDPKPRMPHVLGDNGRIVAIIFGEPLFAPPSPDRGNKILWVSHAPVRPLSDLRIRAERDGQVVNRVVRGGPGPSLIDLPEAGCWHMTLRWSGRSDTLDLRYVPQGSASKESGGPGTNGGNGA